MKDEVVNKRTVAIVQARVGSSRLPGKVLRDVGGQPMLVRVVERTRRARRVDLVVVATTDDPADDPIEALGRARGYPVFRGAVFDVLDRFYQAALTFDAGVVVRITADCPLVDPAVIDHTIDEFFRAGVDFAANRLPPPLKRTFPIGLDTEVCTFSALRRAWNEAQQPYEREHVMPYLYDQPGRFQTLLVNTTPDYGHLRWTVDTPADLELVQRIFAAFANRDDFTWQDVLALVTNDPSLSEINAGVRHKAMTETDERMKKDHKVP